MPTLFEDLYPDYELRPGDLAYAAWVVARPELFIDDPSETFLWAYTLAEAYGFLDAVEVVQPVGLEVDPEPGPRGLPLRERQPAGALRAAGWCRDRPFCRRRGRGRR